MDQHFLALEGLLTWIRAVVVQADRVSSSQNAIVAQIKERPGPEVRALIHTFQAEHHLFCIAAAKLFEYRHRLQDLGKVDPGIFAELDGFEPDVQLRARAPGTALAEIRLLGILVSQAETGRRRDVDFEPDGVISLRRPPLCVSTFQSPADWACEPAGSPRHLPVSQITYVRRARR